MLGTAAEEIDAWGHPKHIIGAVGGTFMQFALVFSALQQGFYDQEGVAEFFNKKGVMNFLVNYISNQMKCETFPFLVSHFVPDFMSHFRKPLPLNEIFKMPNRQFDDFRELIRKPENYGDEVLS